jgi:ketosteroid isomerase-like protein
MYGNQRFDKLAFAAANALQSLNCSRDRRPRPETPYNLYNTFCICPLALKWLSLRQTQPKGLMQKYIIYMLGAFFAMSVVCLAAPDKAANEAREKSAWQAYKDKKADEFKKLVDKDLRCVYANGIQNLQNELDDMKKWDIKSFTFSDFDSFSDEPDVIVTTYKVAIEATYDGKDVSGTYNAGSIWKKEKNAWLAIFHTNIKAETAATPATSPSS